MLKSPPFRIGMVQGRLTKQRDERLHVFPRTSEEREEEFRKARNLGFEAIEWLFYFPDYEENPIFSREGEREMDYLRMTYNIAIPSLDADYFVDRGFKGKDALSSVIILNRLITKCAKRGIKNIVIPFFGANAIENERDKKEIVKNFAPCVREAEKNNIKLLFESPLPAFELKEFIDRFKSRAIRVNYDTGNMTTVLGEKVPDDIKALAPLIESIHIKDRKYGLTTSYPLGEGETQFNEIFKTLQEIGYHGPLIFETARDSATEDYKLMERYKLFLDKKINEVFSRGMQNPIGIMQGRLSPSEGGRFQFFPQKWQDEFRVARDLGFDGIEWLFDWVRWEKNPIYAEGNVEEIRSVSDAARISVDSICSDYYMKYGFTGSDAASSIEVLLHLIERAGKEGYRTILVPFLEERAIKSESEKKEIVKNFDIIIERLKKSPVAIGFETEMPAPELLDFIFRFDSPNIGVYYDLGNSTSYGVDCVSEIRLLGKHIKGVHLKDRKKGATASMLLGTGDVDFVGCFKALKEVGYKGPLILQAWRGENFLEDARTQLLFVKKILRNI